MTEFSDPPRPATAFDHDSTLVVAMELSGKSWQLGGGGSRRVAMFQARPEGRRHGRAAGNYAITVLLYLTPSGASYRQLALLRG
jgi:hypothetical protein